ncbi:MAG: D-aminoacylase [Pyramidobacter porci]|uniref:N-acyl-D-amino-acid deacylase family protein n=1 Tax=Pyramidobacter porci TaxID=2605789 RepID=UPI002A759509|nr:D-aminoacylase [Pyramidobacter porci]MDY2647212.1 D-aminoacylase [Pyramidobacter porci]
MYDYILRHGKIMDGTNNPWYYSDVGIKDGRIAEISRDITESAAKVIDVSGLAVAPGFIDMHTHTELTYLVKPDDNCKISQGVTTEIGGLCALSPAPVDDITRAPIENMNNPLLGVHGLKYDWNSMAEFLDVLKKSKHVTNIGTLQGHNAIRTMAMGFEDRPPTEAELKKMMALLRESLEAGVFGFSTAGVQSPSNFADTPELLALCSVVAEYGGIYETHLRSESNAMLDAVAETLLIAKKTGVRAQVAHHKASGKINWGKLTASLRMIDESRQMGCDTGVDMYPYTYASFNLEALLPPWVRGNSTSQAIEILADKSQRPRILNDMQNGILGSGWESVYQWCGFEGIHIGAVAKQKNMSLQGKSIAQIARDRGCGSIDVVCDILCDEGFGVLMLLDFGCEEDIETALRYPFMAPVTDALTTHLHGGGNHPRIFGTFPKVLGHYARDRKLMSMEEAVRRMTSLPACRLGLKDRGLLFPGYAADITVFNSDTVIDTATLEKPKELAAGIEYVFVNGVLGYKDKQIVDLGGALLLRKGKAHRKD